MQVCYRKRLFNLNFVILAIRMSFKVVDQTRKTTSVLFNSQSM